MPARKYAGKNQEILPAGEKVSNQLPSTIDRTLSARGSLYGDFSDNARISQQLKSVLENERSWAVMPHLHREGITMIFQKISRIVNGDPNYKDNWHDIQGYAKLVEDRLP